MKVLDRDPFPFSLSIPWLAMIDMETKLEVRKGLLESPDKLLDFNIYSYFFLNITS